MRSVVKLAIIGCGYWGKNLARNFAEIGALYAIVDPNPEVARSWADTFEVKMMTIDQVLADSTVDAVAIAAPAELHKDLTLKALQAGKHVYVEKPLALSVEDGEAMQQAAQSAGRKLMVGHLLQYHPVFVALRDMVRKGELGEIRYAYSHRLSMGKFRIEEDVFWSLAPHDVSMLLALFDEVPLEVRGSGLDFITPGVADEARLDMVFSGRRRAHIFTSWLHPFKEQRLVVVGDEAMAVFEDSASEWDKKLALYRHRVDKNDGPPVPVKAEAEYIQVPKGDEPLKAECQHFLDCITQDTTPITDAQEALRVLRVMAAFNLPKAV